MVGMLSLFAVLLAGCANPFAPPLANPHLTPPTATDDWPVFSYDAARSGDDPEATPLTGANVAQMQRLWAVELPDVADSSPILLHGLIFPDGKRRDGRLLARDAATGHTLWSTTQGIGLMHWESPIVVGGALYVGDENGIFMAYGLAT